MVGRGHGHSRHMAGCGQGSPEACPGWVAGSGVAGCQAGLSSPPGSGTPRPLGHPDLRGTLALPSLGNGHSPPRTPLPPSQAQRASVPLPAQNPFPHFCHLFQEVLRKASSLFFPPGCTSCVSAAQALSISQPGQSPQGGMSSSPGPRSGRWAELAGDGTPWDPRPSPQDGSASQNPSVPASPSRPSPHTCPPRVQGPARAACPACGGGRWRVATGEQDHRVCGRAKARNGMGGWEAGPSPVTITTVTESCSAISYLAGAPPCPIHSWCWPLLPSRLPLFSGPRKLQQENLTSPLPVGPSLPCCEGVMPASLSLPEPP